MSLFARILFVLYLLFIAGWVYRWNGSLPLHVDASLYAYPDRAVNLEAFHKGLLPLWNPYVACGTPHLANWQSACLYPPFWLFNWTGLGNAYMAMALAHAAWAFLGFFLWLRRLKLDPLPSVLGAIAFAGSAHLTLSWANLPFIATASWIPWVFFAAHRALERKATRDWVLLALFVGLQALAGYPFFLLYTVIFLSFWFEGQRPSASSRMGFWLALGVAALATSAQWLPFLEMLTTAKPDHWTEYPYFNRWADLRLLFTPNAWGLLGSPDYRAPFANGNFNPYFGLVPLGFLLWGSKGLFTRSGGPSLRWTLAAFIALLWTLGSHCPLWKFIPRTFLEFLEPSKAVGLFLFCAATASALGFRSLAEGKGKLRKAAALLLALAWTLDLLRLPMVLHHPMPNPYQDIALQARAAYLKTLSQGGRILSLQPSDATFLASSAEQALKRQFNFQQRSFLANSNMAWGFPSPDRYLYLQVDGSENLLRYFNKGFPYEGDLLDVAGVRYLLLSQKLDGPKYRFLARVGERFLMENQGAAGSSWVRDASVECPDRVTVLNSLSRPHSGWKEEVFLERNGADLVQLSPARDKRDLVAGADAGFFSFRGKSEGPGFVGWDTTYCPGWHAWVDGAPAPILRAYGLFMGVAVTAGDHRVDFRYEPVSFRLGLFLSFIAMALAGFLAVRTRLLPGPPSRKR